MAPPKTQSASHAMHEAAAILLSLFIIFVAAQVGAEIAQRLKLPGVVGEIVAGCVIGPSVLGWIEPAQIASGTPLDVLSEIGVVLLLFAVGLETRLDDLKKVGRSAFLVGVLGVLVPFVLGTFWAHYEGFDWTKSLFVAAAFVATSAGITARVLQELGALSRIESRVILGAAVIDDILAMLLLGVVTSLQSGGAVQVGSLALVLAQAVGFVAVIGWVGTRVMRRSGNLLEKPINPLSPLTISLAICLGLAFLSTEFGLAAIIGAFLAGMIASETKNREELEHQTQPLLAFLTPFFFVVTGAKIDVGVFASGAALGMLAVVTVIAIVSKLAGGFLGALSLGRRGATIVGVGMVPRGEVGVVIASLGLAGGVFSNEIYAVIVAMSLLTSIVTPPVLAVLLRREQEEYEATPPHI
jgi:Kef-type K+ transport system membrane component KefB